MTANPVNIGMLKNSGNARKISATVGATAVRFGQLVKFSSGALVTVADNDPATSVIPFVMGVNADAAATKAPAYPLADVIVAMQYTGGTPTAGVSYGVSDGDTVDVADTTNLLVTVLEVDTDLEICYVTLYGVSA